MKQTVICLAILLMLHCGSKAGAQELQPAKKGYAPVNGIELYYEIYGQGKPVVLLHGSYMTIGMNWGALIPELLKNRQVIALELDGHGRTALSNRPLDYVQLADDVAKTLQHLQIDSADIIGYSFGGTVAFALAIHHPQLVKKAVIISSTYRYDGWTKEAREIFHSMTPEFLTNTPLKTEYDKLAPEPGQWNAFLAKMIEFDKTDFNLGDENIRRLRPPFLIICGDNDGVDKDLLHQTYRLLGGDVFADMAGTPKSQLAILPGQGHVSLMMQTGLLVQLIENFLK